MALESRFLYGAWTLEGFEQLESNGLILKSLPSSKGLLIYLPTGEMSVSMSREIDSEDLDIKKTFVRNLFYAGTYKVEDQTIFHNVQIALHDQHRNKILPRRARLEDKNHRLVLEALDSNKKVMGTIFWRNDGISPKTTF